MVKYYFYIIEIFYQDFHSNFLLIFNFYLNRPNIIIKGINYQKLENFHHKIGIIQLIYYLINTNFLSIISNDYEFDQNIN